MIGPAEGPVHLLRHSLDGLAMGVRCRPSPKPAGRGGSYDRAQRQEAAQRRATVWESQVTCPACRLPS